MIQNLTALDIALPIGLGAMFGFFRYQAYLRAQLEDAKNRAAMDAVKGILGMAAITLILKYFAIT